MKSEQLTFVYPSTYQERGEFTFPDLSKFDALFDDLPSFDALLARVTIPVLSQAELDALTLTKDERDALAFPGLDTRGNQRKATRLVP